MPYIKQDERCEDLMLYKGFASNPGELNFQITNLALHYWESSDKQNYQRLNDIIGALECAKQEFYRRVVVPYEEQKRFENGDVYGT